MVSGRAKRENWFIWILSQRCPGREIIRWIGVLVLVNKFWVGKWIGEGIGVSGGIGM